MYIIICEMKHQSRFDASLGLVQALDDPEGRDGKGGGRGVQDGEHMYTRGRLTFCMAKSIQYCKVISLQLK